MAEKGFQYRAALLLILVFTILLTFFGCLHTLGTTDKTISKTSTSLSTLDDEISDQIIVSANDYLELTTCGNLEEAPMAADAAAPVRRPIVELTEDEIFLMSCEVYCEAYTEPYDAQVGVAHVILARILSPYFPDNLYDVLYEDNQFPPMYSGVVDEAIANRSGDLVRDAVMDALYGANPVGNHLFFNMEAGVNLDDVSRYMRIGTTIFYTPTHFTDDGL